MAYQVHEATTTGSFAFRAAAPDTGVPILVTMYTGEAVIAADGAMAVSPPGVDNAEPVRFFVPHVAPLADGAGLPVVLAEMYLCGVVVNGAAGVDTNSGVTNVTATYAPDPRGGTARWLMLAFTCRASRGMRVGYRITVSQTLGG